MLAKTLLTTVALAAVAGCPGTDGSAETDKLAAVQAKVDSVTSHIGGTNGFGGMRMASYMQGMPAHMGFASEASLADPNGHLNVHMVNHSNLAATMHLSYFCSNLPSPDQTQDVPVPAGGETTVQIPCAEIVGTGSLDTPGTAACRLSSGTDISNMMTLPAFLGTDYTCGGTYEMTLTPDANNLTGGGTGQLIMMSGAMSQHMASMMQGGMMGPP